MKSDSPSPSVTYVLGSAFRYAQILGLIGFVGGFFGPMLLVPDANQGPMLGLFITGPLGFLIGLIVGTVIALRRGRRS